MGLFDGITNKIGGAFNSATGAVGGAFNKAKDKVESKAKDLAAQAFALAFYAALLGGAYFFFSRNQAYIMGGIFNPTQPGQRTIVIGGLIFIIVLFALSIWAIRAYSSKYKRLRYFDPMEQVLGPMKAVGIFDEGFQNQTTVLEQSNEKLLTTQPLTAAHAGLSGQDTFDPVDSIPHLLQSGFRSFVLYIDYSDKEPKKPLLVHTDTGGAFVATGSIYSVCEAIAKTAFRGDTGDIKEHTLPVMIYLHVLRTPPNTSPQTRKVFLENIAKELAPITPNHLGNSSSLGKFTRQEQEENLLTIPLRDIGQSIIIASNVDTSVFKTGRFEGGAVSNDLDYYVNMRVYLEKEGLTGLGVTTQFNTSSGKSQPSAVITTTSYLSSLIASATNNTQSDNILTTFKAKGNSRFVIAMPNTTKNPSISELDSMMALGVNMIPLNIYAIDGNGDGISQAEYFKTVGEKYKGMAWPLKTAV